MIPLIHSTTLLDSDPHEDDKIKFSVHSPALVPHDCRPDNDPQKLVDGDESQICYAVKARQQPIPTPLFHICQESRALAKRHYSEAFPNPGFPGVGGELYVNFAIDTFHAYDPRVLEDLCGYIPADGCEFIKTWIRQVRHLAISGNAVRRRPNGEFAGFFEGQEMFCNLETITLEANMVLNDKGKSVQEFPGENGFIEETIQEKLLAGREMRRARQTLGTTQEPDFKYPSTTVKSVPTDTLLSQVNEERKARGKGEVVVDEWEWQSIPLDFWDE